MKEVSPKRKAKQVLLGTLLGDAWLHPNGNRTSAYLAFSHKEAHEEYALWKAKLLEPLLGKIHCRTRERVCNLGKGKTFRSISIRFPQSKYVKHIDNDFYFIRDGKRKKEVHLNVLNRLTPLSLAVWFGDDGSISHKQNGRLTRVNLATCGFSEEENKMIAKYFSEKWGVDFCRLRRTVSGGIELCSSKEGALRFLEIIRPHLSEVKCLSYKLQIFKPRTYSPGHPYKGEDIVRTPKKLGEAAEMTAH